MSQGNDTERGTVRHAHARVDRHEERITALEQWKQRAIGALALLTFLVSVFGAALLAFAL